MRGLEVSSCRMSRPWQRIRGLTVQQVRTMKKHIFFGKHEFFDPDLGQVVRSRFGAMGDTAYAWEQAASRPLVGAERKWFQQLAAP